MPRHSILINGLKIYAYHGVMPQERTVGATFTIDMKIDTDFTQAIETDQLDGTISYAEVCEVVRREMAIPSQLLEHVGGRIVKALQQQIPEIKAIRLKLIKDNPPMGADLQGAGIEIETNY